MWEETSGLPSGAQPATLVSAKGDQSTSTSLVLTMVLKDVGLGENQGQAHALRCSQVGWGCRANGMGGYMMACLSVHCVHPFGGYMMARLSVHCVHSFMKRGSFQHSLDCALAPLYLSLEEALGKVCIL